MSVTRPGPAVENAGLDQHGEAVRHSPVLHQAAVHDAGDVDHGEVDRAVARRPEERAGRGPPSPHPDPDGVALLDRVLDREADVGHGPVNVGDRVLEVLDRLGPGPARPNWWSTRPGAQTWSATEPSPVAKPSSKIRCITVKAADWLRPMTGGLVVVITSSREKARLVTRPRLIESSST